MCQSENRLLQTRIGGNVDRKKNKDQFDLGLTLTKNINQEMTNLLLGVQSTFDLSKVDFSSGFDASAPDLAGMNFLMVILAGVLALRLGTTLRDNQI